MSTNRSERPQKTAAKATESLVRQYVEQRPESKRVFSQAVHVLPGGQTRSVTHFAPFPTVLQEGQGPYLIDVDGNDYIDLTNNYTSLIHGNSYAPASNAVRDLLGTATAFPSIHPLQIQFAELLCERIPSFDRVRFTNSGSEASALASRIARAATNRTELIVVEGAYHGGVPPFSENTTREGVTTIPFNDPRALEEAVSDRTAAIFLEPFLGAGGVLPATQEFLQTAQHVANNHGALFVLDEIQSFRNHVSGTQTALGLDPDLTLLGKIIGGGFPIGAVGGKEEFMQHTSPFVGDALLHAGTFNGHLAAMAAGNATLTNLPQSAIDRLNTQAQQLDADIRDHASQAGFDISVTRAGSILNVYPGKQASVNAEEAAQHHTFHSALHLALMLEGIYTTPRGMINLSTPFDPALLERVVRGYQNAFHRLADIPHDHLLQTNT